MACARKLTIPSLICLLGKRFRPTFRAVSMVVGLAGVLALCLPNVATAWEAKEYAVYEQQFESRVPQNPACRSSANPACRETRVFAWKAGPIQVKVSDTTGGWPNTYGDPVYYQLLKDYRIDLKPYFLERYNGGLPEECRYHGGVPFEQVLGTIFGYSLWWPREFGGFTNLYNGVLTIKKGYRWDGPSLEIANWNTNPPKLSRIGAKPTALMRASLVHDALYGFPRMGLVAADSSGDVVGKVYRLMADCMLFMLSRQDGTVARKHIGSAAFNFGVVRSGGAGYTDPERYRLPRWKFHPVADAGPDQEIPCAVSDADSIDVELDGTASQFSEGLPDEIYSWEGAFGQADGAQPTVSLATGTHVVMLSVDDCDDCGNGELNFLGPFQDTDKVVITVKEDTVSPATTIVPAPLVLRARPGQFETIHVEDFVTAVSDDCSDFFPGDAVIDTVTSNETVRPGDIIIAADRKSVMLRRRLARRGETRVYNIFVEVIDEAGNVGTASYEVHVVKPATLIGNGK